MQDQCFSKLCLWCGQSTSLKIPSLRNTVLNAEIYFDHVFLEISPLEIREHILWLLYESAIFSPPACSLLISHASIKSQEKTLWGNSACGTLDGWEHGYPQYKPRLHCEANPSCIYCILRYIILGTCLIVPWHPFCHLPPCTYPWMKGMERWDTKQRKSNRRTHTLLPCKNKRCSKMLLREFIKKF